jgi:hypothetical protein
VSNQGRVAAGIAAPQLAEDVGFGEHHRLVL